MKRILVFSLLSCTLLVACTPSRRQSANVAPFPREPDIAISPDANAIPSETVPGTDVEAVPTPAPTPKPVSAVAPLPPKREARYGLHEPGKPGYMRSPYNPEAGLIDYRGLPPGTEVKDPYTPGKIILVP